MRFVESIDREDTNIIVRLNSNLGTCRPIYQFTFNCGENQERAELITRNFNKVFDEYCEYVASNPLEFISGEKVSKVKKFLIEHWNGKDHCYK